MTDKYKKPHIADERIRAALEGPFLGYECEAEIDAVVLDKKAREAGALCVLYQKRFLVISSHGEPVEELQAFIERVSEYIKGGSAVLASGPPRVVAREQTMVDCLVAVHDFAGLKYDPVAGRIYAPETPGAAAELDLGRQELFNPDEAPEEEVSSL